MEWGVEQEQALSAVNTWLKDPSRQVFRLFGYAGTGKTTLAKHFAEGVDGTVLFGAYTGKAAHVLQQKGCTGASTIHSLIYHTKDRSKAKLKSLEAELVDVINEIRNEARMETPEITETALSDYVASTRVVKNLRAKIKEEREAEAGPMFTKNIDSAVKGASLVVIDECSMVDGAMGEDLLSFGTKVLVLGDPAQLPPVMGAGFFTEDCVPDIMLEDIHRQAKDNPIIAMATTVRNKGHLDLGDYGDSRVVQSSDPEEALAADQILVGKNKTRKATNRRMRQLLQRDNNGYPVFDDRLVCLRNNHELGLLNGGVWHVRDVGHTSEDLTYMSIQPEFGGNPIEVEAHSHYFLGRDDELSWFEKKDAQEFDYGYALTVHKSQGSQWNNVLLFDESYCFKKDRFRWLYTGLTRAAERVTVVKM